MTGNPGPKVFSFQCEQCGSPIPVHAPGHSLTFVCPSCSSIVQETNNGARVIQKAQADHYKSLLELGAKAIFRGDKWQILGFMVRSDIEESFYWREYLLFNPKKGFRFLTESEGHWTFLTITRTKPNASQSYNYVTWGGRRYQTFYQGQSKVQFVLGEFYWRVKIGDEAKVADYISPPEILSSEQTEDEIIWSVGSYIPRDDIQKAFLNVFVGQLPEAVGVAPNQVSPYQNQGKIWTNWAVFALILLAIQVLAFNRSDRSLFTESLARDQTQVTQKLTTQSFEVKGENSTLEIAVNVPLTNTWSQVDGLIVPEGNQMPAVDFSRDFSAYSGYDGEEYWKESDNDSTLIFPQMKPGLYHLTLQVSRDSAISPGAVGNKIYVSVKDDTTTYWPFWLALAALTAFPLMRHLFVQNFERKRLLNSSWGD